MKRDHTNTLTSILSLLNVRYTSKYANRYFNEHPYKYSLFGLSKMLTHYGVHNVGIKVSDKENFFKKYAYVADDNVSPEYQTHLEWKRKTKLQAIPTVLFDGYELPEMYFQQIEKLIFFTDLEVDTR